MGKNDVMMMSKMVSPKSLKASRLRAVMGKKMKSKKEC